MTIDEFIEQLDDLKRQAETVEDIDSGTAYEIQEALEDALNTARSAADENEDPSSSEDDEEDFDSGLD
jgi:hypothetical protein